MKGDRLKRFFPAALTGVATLCIAGIAVAAEEGSAGWRSTYDAVMLWINFGILVAVFIKFAKNPIVSFLKLRQEQTQRDIQLLEEEKKNAEAKARETTAMIKQGEARLTNIKQKIMEEGEREKARIIQEAQEQSRTMLEEVRKRVGHQIGNAKAKLKEELVDTAIALAEQQLPSEITDQDQQGFVDHFLSQMKG